MGLFGSGGGHHLPATFERLFPHFKEFIEVAPGFWNYRTDFFVVKLFNIKTHMSVARLKSGNFVSIDAAVLSPQAKAELDELTGNGEKLVGCVFTHPFHTLAIPAFHAAYPATDTRKYYGAPRHLGKITKDTAGADIKWSGNLNDEETRKVFEPDIEMRIPAGSEFVDPKPPSTNHFSNVFVFHPASKTVFNDDTVGYFRSPSLMLRLLGARDDKMTFHMTIKSYGLYKTKEAPLQFLEWFQKMLDDWDFDNLISAHTAGCYGGAKARAQKLLNDTEPLLRDLSAKNEASAAAAAKDGSGGAPAAACAKGGADGDAPKTGDGWSNDPSKCECG